MASERELAELRIRKETEIIKTASNAITEQANLRETALSQALNGELDEEALRMRIVQADERIRQAMALIEQTIALSDGDNNLLRALEELAKLERPKKYKLEILFPRPGSSLRINFAKEEPDLRIHIKVRLSEELEQDGAILRARISNPKNEKLLFGHATAFKRTGGEGKLEREIGIDYDEIKFKGAVKEKNPKYQEEDGTYLLRAEIIDKTMRELKSVEAPIQLKFIYPT